MRLEDKRKVVESLTKQINATEHLYLTDISDLDAEKTSDLRRICYKNDVQLVVAKNTLIRKAFEQSEKNVEELYDVLKTHTSIMFTATGNAPAKLIKEFRKKNDRPILKAAYVEESIYIGDDQLDALVNVKSKNELIGDVVALLQSPMKNVVSSLQSGGNILTGVLKTLSEKEK